MCQGAAILAVTFRVTVSPCLALAGVISVVKDACLGLMKLSLVFGLGPSAAGAAWIKVFNRRPIPGTFALDDGPGRTVSSTSGRVHWPGTLQFSSSQIM